MWHRNREHDLAGCGLLMATVPDMAAFFKHAHSPTVLALASPTDTGQRQYEPRFLNFQGAPFPLHAVASVSSSRDRRRRTVFQLPQFTPREAGADGREMDAGFCRLSEFLVPCWGMTGEGAGGWGVGGGGWRGERAQRSQAESPPLLTALQIPPHPHPVVKSLSEHKVRDQLAAPCRGSQGRGRGRGPWESLPSISTASDLSLPSWQNPTLPHPCSSCTPRGSLSSC